MNDSYTKTASIIEPDSAKSCLRQNTVWSTTKQYLQELVEGENKYIPALMYVMGAQDKSFREVQ